MCDWMEINNNIQELQEGATFPKRKKKWFVNISLYQGDVTKAKQHSASCFSSCTGVWEVELSV